jgi:hypothetical protein
MRKFFILVLLLVPWVSGAHGSVSKNVGNAVVYLNQTPLSPFVGEKVNLAFTITDTKFQTLKNTDVQLVLVDTFFNDASRDQTILTQNLKTDDNGALLFEYRFPKSDYYDVELSFKDPVTGVEEATGFLVQPRQTVANKFDWMSIGITALAAIAIGYIVGRMAKRKNTT